MSFLNALASSGLSVGLRLSNTNYFSEINKNVTPLSPDDCCQSGSAASPCEPRTARPDPGPLSPEERAAGRAEVKAQLEADGCLGRIGCAAAGAEALEAEPGEEAAGASGVSGQEEGPLKKLTPEEEEQVRKLAQRDQEVKTHEQAHVAASGGLAGAPSYTYQTGPDGRQYAVGGEVSISRGGGGGDTEQAIAEAEAVKRGATAPAQPSSQDLAVAAKAEGDIQRLKAQKAQEEQEEQKEAGKAPAGADHDLAAPENANQDKGAANGAALGSQVIGAYAAVKFGFQSAVRPLLARI
ncbi:MAG: hypothetical protein FWG97_04805 [Deltaproteobacteria bacterium]|nr:hypothetical protein [Deltaproteobacteria bacterium]